MDDEIALEYAPSRFYSIIVAVFSVSALLLTTIGLFALLSHAAAQRMSEMGLRLALGATPRAMAALLLANRTSTARTGRHRRSDRVDDRVAIDARDAVRRGAV